MDRQLRMARYLIEDINDDVKDMARTITKEISSTKRKIMGQLPKLVPTQNITLGTDPEFFFKKDGEIVGSEKVIPEGGIPSYGVGLTVIDGVQAELHPHAAACREVLARNIKGCLLSVEHAMREKGMTADFSQVVDVKKEELDTLLPKNKRFGCSASMNTHKEGEDKVTIIKADPLKYLKRSAGGHVHIGAEEKIFSGKYEVIPVLNPDGSPVLDYNKHPVVKHKEILIDNPAFNVLKNPDVLVPCLDIIVGNTAVLLDRDPGNTERRKNYGKAGEYRLPKYGLEYRTLSNFWLRGNPLFALMFGLVRQTVNMVEQSNESHDYVAALRKLVDIKDVEKAINENDFDLATENFKKILPFLISITPTGTFYPITSETLPTFEKLVELGVDHFFTQNVMDAWIRPNYANYGGFYTFHQHVVAGNVK